jgi:hypothetical protein
MLTPATPLDVADLAPARFDDWHELEAPGIQRVRVLTHGTATAVLVAGAALFDLVATDGDRRLVLTLTPDEVADELARIAAEFDELHA